MQGLHLTADLFDCDVSRAVMTDTQTLRTLCLTAVQAVGLQPVGELFYHFAPLSEACASPSGITGVVLLAESHLAVHTWPEQQAVTLDVYVCNLGHDNSQRAQALMNTLSAAFGARRQLMHALERGQIGT